MKRSVSSKASPRPHLCRLEIKNLATISRLELELQAGFCAFTGETGAGKSIIVDALGLLSGGRANTDLIRSDEKELLISGFWHNALSPINEDETNSETGTPEAPDTLAEVSISRRLTAQGRSTARLEGEVVTLREVQRWIVNYLTIHWQHSAVSLLSANKQRSFLDSRLTAPVTAYAEAYQAWRAAATRLDKLQASQRERARQLDLLQFQVQEISTAALEPNEEEPLINELKRLSNLHNISQSAASALELLADGEVNAEGLVGEAVRELNAGAKYDQASAELQDELREALAALQAVVSELRETADHSAPDPAALDQAEARLALLGKLKQKYGHSLEEVIAYGEKATQELSRLEQDEQDSSQLEQQVKRLLGKVMVAGKALDQARQEAAGPLAAQLLEVIRQLGMPHAQLEFRLRLLEQPASQGLSEVSLLFNANPGEQLAPLADAASGGELSRVMLALSTVLGAETPSVVFDEVDAGIGGAAAQAVAEQLADLAKHKQVLVVTHLAQIAAKADYHYKVEKEVQEGRTISRVRLLEPSERLHEIARMLSGSHSSTALQHASELLGERALGV